MTVTDQTLDSCRSESPVAGMLDSLRSHMRIAIIYGGNSTADGSVIYRTVNPRPWKSYEAVARDIQLALGESGFANVVVMREDMNLPMELRRHGIHFAWLNSGGVQGYSPVSHSAALLEMLGIPYVGHTPENAAMLDNKGMFKRQLQSLGVPTAPFVTWHPANGPLHTGTGSRFRSTFGEYEGPFVVKPISGRASHGITVVGTACSIPARAAAIARETRNSVLVETFLAGREFCVAVCGGTQLRHGVVVDENRPFTFAAIERLLDPGELIFTSMDTRPITTDRTRAVSPDEPEFAQLSDIARVIYRELQLTSVVRIDARMDARGRLNVLEANPKPDLARGSGSTTSLIAAALARSDTSYCDLIVGLLVDRLTYLFRHAPESVRHLADLVD